MVEQTKVHRLPLYGMRLCSASRLQLFTVFTLNKTGLLAISFKKFFMVHQTQVHRLRLCAMKPGSSSFYEIKVSLADARRSLHHRI